MATFGQKSLLALLVALAQVVAASARAQDTANAFLPKEGSTAAQLRTHLERMQKAPPAVRMQAGFREAMVTTADKMLEANPPESLRVFAVVGLLDALHELAEQGSGNTEADQRLAELAEKYAEDNDKKIASTAAFYKLEQRALQADQLSPEDARMLLEEIKAALRGKPLVAKHMRIANATPKAINRLGDKEEATKRFQEFGKIYAASRYADLGRLGIQIKAMQFTPPTAAEVAADDSMPASGPAEMPSSDMSAPAGAVSDATASEAPVAEPAATESPAAPMAAETPAAEPAVEEATLKWIGKPMELDGRTTTGDGFTFDNFKGKVVLVCFWSTQANSFSEMLAQLKVLYEQHHGKGLEVIGVNLDQDPQTRSMAVSQMELPWINLVVETINGELASSMTSKRGVQSATVTFLVGRDGTIVAPILKPEALEEQASKLLMADGSQSPAKPE